MGLYTGMAVGYFIVNVGYIFIIVTSNWQLYADQAVARAGGASTLKGGDEEDGDAEKI